jgi:hypothetical protein
MENLGLIVQNLLNGPPGLLEQYHELLRKEPDLVGAVNLYMDHNLDPYCRKVALEYLSHLTRSNIPPDKHPGRIGHAIGRASMQKRLERERLDEGAECPPTPDRDVSILDGVEDPPLGVQPVIATKVEPAVQRLLDMMAAIAAKDLNAGSGESQVNSTTTTKPAKWASFWASRKKQE